MSPAVQTSASTLKSRSSANPPWLLAATASTAGGCAAACSFVSPHPSATRLAPTSAPTAVPVAVRRRQGAWTFPSSELLDASSAGEGWPEPAVPSGVAVVSPVGAGVGKSGAATAGVAETTA